MLNFYRPDNPKSKANWVFDSIQTIDTKDTTKFDGNPGMFWGLVQNNQHWIREHQRHNVNWYFADMPYWHRWMDDGNKYYWRIVPNNLHVYWEEDRDSRRFDSFEIPISSWRKSGSYILICPSSETMTQYYTGMSVEKWIDKMKHDIDLYTKREIRVRYKPRSRNTSGPRAAGEDTFAKSIVDAWCVVTIASMSSVEAAIAGVPVVCDPKGPAAPIATSLQDIENPRYVDRTKWVSTLAHYQYTEQEIRNGSIDWMFN